MSDDPRLPLMRQRVADFVAVRDKIKEIEAAHKTKVKPLKDLLARISGVLQAFLTQTGADSIATPAGTFYESTRYTASLADPEAFMQYVIANNKFDLLDRRANADAVKDFVKETGSLPPGVNLTAMAKIGVNRGRGEDDGE